LKIVEDLRKPLKKNGGDPLGKKPVKQISKTELDEILTGDDVAAAALVHGAIEEFAQELASAIRRFLKTKAWDGTECIVVGGGFRQSRVGELAIGVKVVGERAGLCAPATVGAAKSARLGHAPSIAGSSRNTNSRYAADSRPLPLACMAMLRPLALPGARARPARVPWEYSSPPKGRCAAAR